MRYGGEKAAAPESQLIERVKENTEGQRYTSQGNRYILGTVRPHIDVPIFRPYP